MPIQNGKVVRARYTSLKLAELSSVDRPAQIGAQALIMKRGGPALKLDHHPLAALIVAKYICEEDGAHTFQEVLQANEFDEKIWPMTSALSQAIRSIMGDKDIAPADKEAKVTQSVAEFLNTVRTISPGAEKRLIEIVSKRTEIMPTIEELQNQIATLKAQIETEKAKTAAADEKAKMAEEEKDKATKALIEATDETIKVDGRDVKKSMVGADSFAVFKSLQNQTLTAQLEKRASSEFGAVVGTDTEKALVLKARESMSEDAQKALDAIMASAQKMASLGFSMIGENGGDLPNVRKARTDFDTKVEEIMKRDGIAKPAAMSKARVECPDLFDEMQGKA